MKLTNENPDSATEDTSLNGSDEQDFGDRKEDEDKEYEVIVIDGKKYDVLVGTVLDAAYVAKRAKAKQPYSVFVSTGKESDPREFTDKIELQAGMYLSFRILKTEAS